MFRDVWTGLRAYGAALKLLRGNGFWQYILIPGLISLGFFVLIFGTAWVLSDNIGGVITSILPEAIRTSQPVSILATLIGAIIIIVPAFIIYKNLVMILVTPWMTKLSNKIENHITNTEYIDERPLASSVGRAVRLNIRLIIRQVAIIGILFVAGFIPVFDFIVPVLIFIVQAYYAGYGNLDYFMDRHYSVGDSISFVHRNRGIALGNGIGFTLLFMIPVLGIFLAPALSVAAATLSGIDVKQKMIAD